jgi:hypothetical protein
MKRSAGVTVIAILSLLGSLFTLVMGALMAVIPFVASKAQPNESPFTPRTFKVLMIGVSAFYALPAIWGILTSIGLLRLKEWARISMIVFSVLLILMSGFGGLTSLLIPFPPPTAKQPVDPSIFAGIRIAMTAFWLALLAVGIWWVVFFNRAKVKQQFVPAQPVFPAGPPVESAYVMPVPAAMTPAPPAAERPLSLTVLAWLLLVGCLFTPLNLWLHAPVIVLTKIVTGWPAALCLLVYAVCNLYIGIGLLRLKPAARTVGVAYYGFWFLNMSVFYLAPGGRLRMVDMMRKSQSMFPWMQPWPNQAGFPFDVTPFLILGACGGLVGLLVPLYFLITRKQAFEKKRPRSRGNCYPGVVQLFLLHHLHVNLDLDVVSNHGLARLEQVVVDEPEIPAVDGGGRRKSAPHIAPGVVQFGGRAVHIERHLAGRTVNGQIANHLQLATGVRNAFGFEFHGRIFFNVEEVGTLQILIPHFDPRIHRTDIDRCRHLGLGDVLLVQHCAASHLGKIPADIRDCHVPHRKLRGRVVGVNCPV